MRRVFRDRRQFLRQCCTAAGALWIPGKAALAAPEYQFHPVYREKTLVDAAVLKVKPDPSGFALELRHERLAAILAEWSRDLLSSAGDIQGVVQALSSGFRGVSWRPLSNRQLRIGPLVERLRFGDETTVQATEFIAELKGWLATFSRLLTAEFQVTQIKATETGLTTRVRYELVGEGHDFYREQRTGYWQLDWTDLRVDRWRMEEEVRSRAKEPFFADVTQAAFQRNASYEAQLCHGADYWRTVLDGASGIDIYGHNGISIGDFDGDGLDDLYVCQAAGLPNRLYRNQGDGTFVDVTDEFGVGILENTACALFADFLNRGRQDLLVVRANGPLLFLNEGGRFRLKPDAFQFENAPQGTFTGAAAADYNGDGLLDVYFCLYSFYQGADQYNYPTPYFAAENGPPNFLMQNRGAGTFRDVTKRTGLDKNNSRYSFCCGWGDFDGNGRPDLYVVNDFGRKNLYRNDGNGTFTDVADQVGVEDVGAGMSVCWSDFNNDGAPDLYVGNMWTAAGERISRDPEFQTAAPAAVRAFYRKHAMGNSLFENGGAAFRDATVQSGTAIGRWAWSSDVWDFDHDGKADIYVANGMISGVGGEDLNSFFWREVVAKSPNTFQSDAEYEQGWKSINELIRSDYGWSGRERNVFFANHGDGTFSDVAGVLGLDFVEDSRAFALADVDGDGRQEVFLKNRNAPQLRMMKSVASALPSAIAFRLRGTKSNRDALGASVTIETTEGQQTKYLQAGSGFLSQHSKELFFGLGQAKGWVNATVRWPSGDVERFKNLTADHRVWLTEGSSEFRSEAFQKTAGREASVQHNERLSGSVETWLLAPILAPAIPAGKRMLLCFRDAATRAFPDVECKYVMVDDPANQELSAVYNLLFRLLFDRHRDMPLPTSFLVNERREIVKIYQGALSADVVKRDAEKMHSTDAERLARALPFHGEAAHYEFGRNYLSLGSIFFQHGYPEYAEDFFQSARQQDPTSAEACYGLGSCYLKLGKNDRAKESFRRAVKLKAGYPETLPNAWNNLGLIAIRDGGAAEAVSYFEAAIQLDPHHFISLENLGNAYKQQKRWNEARETLTRALLLKPQDAEANYSLGMVFAQLDNVNAAFDYLTKALKVRPDYAEALNNLAILYLRTHRRDEAVAAFERCIRAAPTFEQAYLNLARVYAIEGSRERARLVLNELLKQRPDDEAAKQALAQLN